MAAAVTGLPTTGGNVYVMRSTALPREADLPALFVFQVEEQSEVSAMGGATAGLDRLVEVHIEAIAAGEDALDTLDQIALEVREALAGSDLGGLIKYMEQGEFSASFDEEADQPRARVSMIWGAHYRTQQGDPTIGA